MTARVLYPVYELPLSQQALFTRTEVHLIPAWKSYFKRKFRAMTNLFAHHS